ncbi:M48 family metalloprotease [Nitratireductor mangrovi]|uniref:M48 family metalloprotease n=1 Tax=Nitratireductor mangrovi TaxID=2599600 RepID=A0A5B8L311_9HYPH|nr:zinc metalloprotease HtpX [Nitratireductor mangrovi]QDZ02152.1 M48 family metalloprotease [Nitratireductor mangrovi]
MSPATHLDITEQRRSRLLNTVHTWLLAGGSLAILAVCAWAFGGLIAVFYAIGVGAVSMYFMRQVSPRAVLSMYKARPVSRAEFPQGVAIVEELAARAELPAAPRLHIVPSRMMNAFAVGRREDSAIAVTDALARRMTAREFAGIMAHEISHIVHEDVRVMAFADMVSRFTSLMSTVGLFSLILNVLGFAGGYAAQVPWIAVVVLMAAPTIGGLLQMGLSRTREYDADLGAAMLTGDPDGLASALAKLERAQGRLWESLMLPGGRIPDPSLLRTHPPTEERVRRLNALKGARDLPDLPPSLDATGAPRTRRPSFIPSVGASRRHASDYRRIASLMPAERLNFPENGHPGLHASIDPPRQQPRLRPGRGYVWW